MFLNQPAPFHPPPYFKFWKKLFLSYEESSSHELNIPFVDLLTTFKPKLNKRFDKRNSYAVLILYHENRCIEWTPNHQMNRCCVGWDVVGWYVCNNHYLYVWRCLIV